MWKILICSEDRDFMQDLGHRIRRLAGERLKEIRLFSNKEDLDFYTTGRPEESNIILIDISRDNGGIQLAQKILAVQPHSQIIFMASTDKYYLDVYSVDHVYFLKKPIEAVFLMKALNKAGSRLQDMKREEKDPCLYPGAGALLLWKVRGSDGKAGSSVCPLSQ